MSDPLNDVDDVVKTIDDFSGLNPRCLRTMETLCETPGMSALGIQRATTEGGNDQIWADVYSGLMEIPGFPPSAREIANAQSRQSIDPQNNAPASEYRDRMLLIDELQKAGADERIQTEFSWVVLAELLKDVSLVQVWRKLDVEANMLGIPSDRTVAQLMPLVKGHRFEKFILSYMSDLAASSASLQQLVETIDTTLLELPAAPFAVRCMQKLNTQLYMKCVGHIPDHGDLIFEDLKRRPSLMILATGFRGEISSVSPYYPDGIVGVIENHWDENQDRAPDWEKVHAKNPHVMLALARKYRKLSQLDDAERCLKKSIDNRVTFAICRELASIYQFRGDMTRCKETLELALQAPDYGLEGSQIQVQLADILIKEGDWDAASRHVGEAANSGAGWALLKAGRCAEGIEDWPRAEAFHRATSERYPGSRSDWYFWCLRTGHGDIDQARKLAEREWQNPKPPSQIAEPWNCAVGNILNDDPTKAIESLTFSMMMNPDAYAILLAAVLADKLDDTAKRDSLFDFIGQHWKNSTAPVELVNLFRRVLAGKDEPRWNRNSFETLVFESADSEITPVYYLAGEFLAKHGMPELSREYLQCAATSFDVNALVCLLAHESLKSQNIEVGMTRSQELPDDLVPLSKLIRDARFAKINKKYDVALANYAKAIELRPDFVPTYLARGGLHENRGQYAEAIADFNEALRIDPECDKAHYFLGWMLATCDKDEIRNGPEALKHAQQESELRSQDVHSYAVLAAAYAECGEFDKAAKNESKCGALVTT